MKNQVWEECKRIIVVCLAAALTAVNIKSFVRTGGLYPGGVTGLTVLVQRAMEMYLHIVIPYTPVNLLLNAIPIYIGLRFIGKKFTGYSCLMIILSGILTDILPGYVITYDILLISIFGGMISGFCTCLCLWMDATSGGTDFIAIYFSEKKGVDTWNFILAFNILILGLAGLLFGWDKALYSIIFQYAATQVLHLLYKRYQQQTLFIVTNKPNEVCREIDTVSHHGATVMSGEGSYEHHKRSVVYSVVSSAESKEVIHSVKEADPLAFVNAIRTQQLYGNFYYSPTK